MKNKLTKIIAATCIISMCTATPVLAAVTCPSPSTIQSATYQSNIFNAIFYYQTAGGNTVIVMLPSSTQSPTRAKARQFLDSVTSSWSPTAQHTTAPSGLNIYSCSYRPGANINSNNSAASSQGTIGWQHTSNGQPALTKAILAMIANHG